MNAIKLGLFGALCISMLTGCGCSTQENYDNTTQTEAPTSTHGTIMDDAGNAMDDAGQMVEDAGQAVGDMATDAGKAMR